MLDLDDSDPEEIDNLTDHLIGGLNRENFEREDPEFFSIRDFERIQESLEDSE